MLEDNGTSEIQLVCIHCGQADVLSSNTKNIPMQGKDREGVGTLYVAAEVASTSLSVSTDRLSAKYQIKYVGTNFLVGREGLVGF